MLLLKKPLNMFRYVIATLSILFLMSCEDESPTADFVPDSFFRNTIDKIVGKVDGNTFFYDTDPTAIVTDIDGVAGMQIRFVSRDEGDISLVIPVFSTDKVIYRINAPMGDNFIADYIDKEGSRYRAIAPIFDISNDHEGTINITVNTSDRIINGTFSFTAESVDSEDSFVKITEGVIDNISY